jgi:hypothetical protein
MFFIKEVEMKIFALSMPSADVFQILDALDSRAASWEYTARSLSGISESDDEHQIPEECDDPEEAGRIARHFREIAEAVQCQIEKR